MNYQIPVRCSYCKRDMGFKKWDYDSKGAHTDGVCSECYKMVMKEIDRKAKETSKWIMQNTSANRP